MESEVVFWFDVGNVCDHSPLPDCTISLAGCWCGASPRPVHGKREPRMLVAVHVCSEVQQRRPPCCRFMARLTVNDPSQSTLEVSAIFSLTCCKHAGACAFRFSEPFSTDADPTSHRVRLWRGGSASKVLLHRVFFPRVRLHGHPGVCNGPWLLLWSRGEWRDCAAGGHRSSCGPVCSQSAPCNLLFFTQKMSLIICPVGQRLWRPVLHVASFVRRTPLVGGWTSSSPTMRSLLRALGFRSSGSVWSGSFSSLRLSAYCLSRGFSMYLCILFTYDCFQLGSSAPGKLL